MLISPPTPKVRFPVRFTHFPPNSHAHPLHPSPPSQSPLPPFTFPPFPNPLFCTFAPIASSSSCWRTPLRPSPRLNRSANSLPSTPPTSRTKKDPTFRPSLLPENVYYIYQESIRSKSPTWNCLLNFFVASVSTTHRLPKMTVFAVLL